MNVQLDELIEAQDLNGLLRAVDALCAQRDWEALLDLADRCEEAIERGKQLWPIAAHIDYRVALEAPGRQAAHVLHPELGRFALGPLTEVVASTHTWAEVAPYLDTPQVAAYVAQERVLRGEDVTADERAHLEVLELPGVLQEWEPTYTLAKFGSNYVEVSEPWEPRKPLRPADRNPGPQIDDSELVAALVDLVQPWTAESNGAAMATVVEGDAVGAASALTFDALRIGPLSLDEALQFMAWAAASGGAHGRRRGAAFGRFSAWYVASLCAGLTWPPDPHQLGDVGGRLKWFRWDEGQAEEGWVLRLAVVDEEQGWAAAIAATDVKDEGDGGEEGPSSS